MSNVSSELLSQIVLEELPKKSKKIIVQIFIYATPLNLLEDKN